MEIRGSRPSCSRPSLCGQVAHIQSISMILITSSCGAWQVSSGHQTDSHDPLLSVKKVLMSASGGRIKAGITDDLAFSETSVKEP